MSFKKLVILRVFAMDYHSGQGSRGYKILSMTYKRLFNKGFADHMIKAARRTKLYKDLVDKYGSQM
jgi:hypothetical protein